MPELPEIETTCQGLAPHIKAQKILQVIVRNRRLRWTIPDDLDILVSEQTIKQITRRGKYLLIAVDTGTILVHLGMSGTLRVIDSALEPEKHDHVDIVLSSGKSLRYRDPRRFGSILWTNDPATHPLLAQLGPEPLTDAFNGQHLYDIAKRRTLAVKQLIMDGKVVVGVGNIYANEALFAAGIAPDRPANTLSKAQYNKLAKCIKEVLAKAIEAGGTTLKDFVGSDGNPGYFQQTLNVYGRGGLPCYKCARLLKEMRLGQRTTVWCAHCQK